MENPIIKFTIDNDRSIECDRKHAALYTYMGALAIYNHIFAYIDDEHGFHMWQDHQAFLDTAAFMINNEFPLHLNLAEISESDVEAHEERIQEMMSDLTEFPPQWSVDG